MKCPNCKRSGMTVMRRCKKCGGIYCRPCADKGVGDYKKTSANVCPLCGAHNASETAK